MADTETLQRQVDQLTTKLELAEREVASHLEALGEAGRKARQMRADIERLSRHLEQTSTVLTEFARDDNLPDAVRDAAAAALEGPDDV